MTASHNEILFSIIEILFGVFSACVKRVSKVVRDSTEDTLEPFKSNMVSFIERGKYKS